VAENNAEGSQIVDRTGDDGTHSRSISRGDVNTARLEELILEDGRVTWAVTHSTVMKKRKWMFVEWLCM